MRATSNNVIINLEKKCFNNVPFSNLEFVRYCYSYREKTEDPRLVVNKYGATL